MSTLPEINKRDWIACLEKGLRIIEAFSDSHPRLSASTAARRTGVTRTAARRYLLTLENMGYLESDGQMYWLTPRVLRLGWSYFDSAKLPRAVQPHLQRISTALGCAAYFAALDEDDVIFVAKDGTNLVQNIGFVLGAKIPANLSSAGIAMLASWTEEEVDRWLSGRKFIAYSPFTAITENAVRGHINEARLRGYAVLEQQMTPRVRGIAIVIRARNGKVVGAISASLPMGNESLEHTVSRTLPVLRDAENALVSAM